MFSCLCPSSFRGGGLEVGGEYYPGIPCRLPKVLIPERGGG